MKNKKIAVVTWLKESQRSYTLSSAFKACLINLFVPAFLSKKRFRKLFSYFTNFLKTLKILHKKKVEATIGEIPPVYNAFAVALYSYLKSKRFIIDAHSNIFLLRKWYNRLTRLLLRMICQKAVALVVHNSALLELLANWKTRKVEIELKPREIEGVKEKKEKNEFRVLAVVSYSPDEPIFEILKAAKERQEIFFYFSGDSFNYPISEEEKKLSNVFFTGFLEKEKYERLLVSVDAVIALTTRNYTILQGGYDAIGAEKPLLTTDNPLIKKYFYKGAVFVKNESRAISEGLKEIKRNYERLQKEMAELKKEKLAIWQKNIATLKKLLL